MSSPTQPKKANNSETIDKTLEDLDLDSGFCSSIISGPVSELLSESVEIQPVAEEPKIDSKKGANTQSTETTQKTLEQDNMDSAYFDSGMLSSPIETDLAKLSINYPEGDANVQQQSPNAVYFQPNEDGDT